jgi:hypothetical protein
MFFILGGTVGYTPTQTDVWGFFCPRANPNRPNQTDSDTKMGRPIGDSLIVEGLGQLGPWSAMYDGTNGCS